MARHFAGLLTGLLACAGLPAMAQTYNYTAKTHETVLKSGPVTAGGLTWNCKGTSCTISGPWPSPGLGACQSLAAVVGKISSYGHPKSRLSSAQIDACNTSAASAPAALKINPRVLDGSKIVNPGPVVKIPPKRIPPIGRLPVPAPAPSSPDTSTPPAESGPDIMIEEGSYQDYTLYVRAVDTVEYHGTYTGPHTPPTPDVTVARWTGTTLRFPQMTHTGTDMGGEMVFSYGTPPADGVYETGASGYFIEIPISLSEIPQRIASVRPQCIASAVAAGAAAPFPTYPVEHQIGFAEGSLNRRGVVDGDWAINTTVRLPLVLRPMMEIADVHSVQCQLNLTVTRSTGSGIDHTTMAAASDRSRSSFIPGLQAAPGTPSVFNVEVTLED